MRWTSARRPRWKRQVHVPAQHHCWPNFRTHTRRFCKRWPTRATRLFRASPARHTSMVQVECVCHELVRPCDRKSLIDVAAPPRARVATALANRKIACPIFGCAHSANAYASEHEARAQPKPRRPAGKLGRTGAIAARLTPERIFRSRHNNTVPEKNGVQTQRLGYPWYF